MLTNYTRYVLSLYIISAYSGDWTWYVHRRTNVVTYHRVR